MRSAAMELHELMRKLHKLELVQQLAHRRGAQEHGLYFGQMPVLDFIAANPGCTRSMFFLRRWGGSAAGFSCA